ncbi:hypothetical protein FWK35_00022748 [Aphis craccivora]|uniref:Uncharacterized protein n=1 Tax=Aphis craccivora TaxID=307492 RepID=A0A6G0YL59_APHCR|nr:hypothetical protein FWK35_00022748 [Aphis craccivora]
MVVIQQLITVNT